MSNIILEICQKFMGEIVEFFSNENAIKIDIMEKDLKEKSSQFVLEIMKQYLTELDNAIVEDKVNRKKKGIVIERRDEKREIYTLLGQLTYKRTYFYDKKNQNYVYLLDKVVGIDSHDRVTNSVAVKLVEHAASASYGESSNHVCNGEISRQTVMNKIRNIKSLKLDNPSEKRKVRVLHIEADEDHVAMQDGTNSIVPLISIHEGIERKGKRGSCRNIHHISSYGKNIEDLWLEAVNWIDENYDIENIERTYLHGDGALWIKNGLNWLPKSKMVLDKYHINQAVTKATGRQPEYRKDIYMALEEGDKKRFKEIISEMLKKAETEKEKERIVDLKKYILNNWEGVDIYSKESCSGSCTEGHISHVLSKRLSSRPMGWSKNGLKAMAELRAFICSGGRIERKHMSDAEEFYKISKRVKEEASKALKKGSLERLNNVTILNTGKVIPMFKYIRNVQHGDNIF